jgi:type VI secretion system secreted protein Hcp
MSQDEANEIVRETQRRRRSLSALKVVLPTAAALGAGAAVAAAVIPGSDGVIHGCYLTHVTDSDIQRYGDLRLIDPSLKGGPNAVPEEYSCETNEKEITWNQSGPQGPVGKEGPKGEPGTAGGQGAAGSPGAPGTPLIGETEFGLNANGETFLKIKSIKGESTDKTHAGDIQVESFSFGATAQTNIGSATSGAGAGKRSVSTFTITKKLDSASPLLFQAEGTGEIFPEVDLLFAHKVKGSEQDFLQLKIDNALITSIQDGAAAGGAPTEQVTFTFQKAEESLVSANHKLLGSVGFDVSTNLKF